MLKKFVYYAQYNYAYESMTTAIMSQFVYDIIPLMTSSAKLNMTCLVCRVLSLAIQVPSESTNIKQE